MINTTYKLNNRLLDHPVAQTLVVGFTSQLKRWWDNHITFDDGDGILKAYRVNEDNEVVKDEEGQDIEDAKATIIFSISKHFIGDPAKIKDKATNLLTNLKCPKLHDFTWYRDILLTKVMLKPDYNQSFQKEKFILGLPRLFFENIRIKIKEQFNGQIPYNKLTFREIISIVTTEGISLCNDFKLKQQMKMNRRSTRISLVHSVASLDLVKRKPSLSLSNGRKDKQQESLVRKNITITIEEFQVGIE